MTPLRFVSILGPVLLIGAGVFFLLRSPSASDPMRPKEQSKAEALAKPPATSFGSSKPMERVVKLYEAESARIGKVDPDPDFTQKRLEAAAKELNLEELDWLSRQASDEKIEMDARVFAMPKTKSEMRFAEERALRMQAVEGLSRNCGNAAREGLLEVVASYDEALRDRAHRALYACHTGKRIEDGDREALEKVQKKATK
jgi:hypothetical protein